MKTLIVEDDFTSRLLMQKILSPYGEIHIAVDGDEAVEAFRSAIAQGQPYDLVCLDILMPRMDGQAVLKEIREMEERNGILGLDGVKIIMTTALKDSKNIMKAFNSQCEAYLTKPIDKRTLLKEIQTLGLLEAKDIEGAYSGR